MIELGNVVDTIWSLPWYKILAVAAVADIFVIIRVILLLYVAYVENLSIVEPLITT